MPPADGSLDTCRPRALRWICESGLRRSGDVDAWRIVGGIDYAEVIVLAQKGLFILRADLEVIDSLTYE